MRTTIDLPRPLLLRVASRAARRHVPLSRFIAESLEDVLDQPAALPPPDPAPPGSPDPGPDPLFDAFRAELGL